MKDLLILLGAFLCAVPVALCQPTYDATTYERLGQFYLGTANKSLPNGIVLNGTNPLPASKGGTGLTDSGTDATKVLGSNGAHGFHMVSGGGGGSSPFAPAGFANVSTFAHWYDLAISPDGAYVYVSGLLSSGSAAVAKVKVSDGSVTATCDLGTTAFTEYPGGLAVSPDGAALYVSDQPTGASAVKWWKIATSAMTITHASTLAVAISGTSGQPFDLSPDGTIYAYVSGADAKLYMINTSTYAVTNQTMSHTAGNLTAVCFYNGSNSNVYVAHAGSGDVDLYAIGGAYTSTYSTGASGTPTFNAMRSGINGTFFIADSGTNKELINAGGSTILVPSGSIKTIAVNAGSSTSIDDGEDVCYFKTSTFAYAYVAGQGGFTQLPIPNSLLQNGSSGIAVMPDSSERVLTLSGVNYPEVWSLDSLYVVPTAGTAGNIQASDGLGNWTSAAPFSTTGWTGTGSTIGGGGTVTVTCAPCTTGSIIDVSPTGTANVLPPAVTTKSNGSFVVSGTATGTFDWCLLSP